MNNKILLDQTQELFTSKEIMKKFGIAPITLGYWRNCGKIKYAKLGEKCFRYFMPEERPRYQVILKDEYKD
jgi:DNA-binding transcriptional MerR regulator